MTLQQRNFNAKNDIQAMQTLSAAFPQESLHITDLPYRLSSWALDDPANIALWQDGRGNLLAWAVMNLPFWAIDYALDPAVEEEAHQRILDWADQRAVVLARPPHQQSVWFINAFADQVKRQRVLHANGYLPQTDVGEDSWSGVWMQRNGQAAVGTYRIPAGFTVRPLAGEAEVEAYETLHQATFETKNMTAGWRRRTIRHPDYTPELDIVVSAPYAATPNGRLGAFCIGWIRKAGGKLLGQIEPLGCHADFRRYALGRLALAEVLRRMGALGVECIHVETDNYRNTALRLYESMGFQVVRDIWVYRKEYGKDFAINN
jgi:ribosomal protein S18 acetylase RimI-like enzyme